jgi:hypothetical protein
MTDAPKDALERSAIEFLVVDDENGGFAQWNFLRVAEGGEGESREPGLAIQASRIRDR